MADFDGLNPIFAQQLMRLIAASGGRIRLESGYRSIETQTRLWNEALARYGSPEAARKWVAPPGKSNHNKGAAGDLAGDLELAHQLAPQFGLAFPMDWEPWHIEMASTRQHADEQAYTDPPLGGVNPKQADFSTDPAQIAATLGEALLGARNAVASPGRPGVLDQMSAERTVEPQSVGGAGGGSVTQGDVSPQQLYAALTAAGLPPNAAAAFVSIAGRESGYNTAAHNDNASTGDDSLGLFQVNLLNGGWTDFLKAHGMADPRSELTTLEGSVKAAAAIYGSSGLHPWGGYKGMPWWYSTDLDVGASASGGAVSVADMRALGGG